MKAPFDRIRARFLLPWLGLGVLFGFAPGELVRSKEWLRAHPDDPLPLVVGSLLISSVIFVFPALYAWWAGLSFRDLYGRFPSRPQFVRLALGGIPSVALTVAVFYVVFAPLSLVFPDGVQSWLFSDTMSFYSTASPYPYLTNLISLFAIVVAAPVAEEWFVRGLLLGRWSRTVGTERAIVRTSIMFGLLHTDIPGALVGGILLCGLYAHYASLWAPTIVHASHNLIVWLFVALSAHTTVSAEITNVAELRAAWWLPVAGLLLAAPWAIALRGRIQPFASWRFPEPATRASTASPGYARSQPVP